MEKYYHFTSYENLKNINEYGLIPQNGDRTKSIGDNRCAIFLSQGILNTILMYSNILHHYNNNSGNLGTKAIRYYKNQIEEYNKQAKEVPLTEEDIAEVNAMKKAIERIKHIMLYKDFFEYIDNGVYLSISNIEDINTIDTKDCYTTKNIPSEVIKVVLLKNRQTGELIDSREKVLAYFMSITPIENILDNTNNGVTISNIKDLYKYKMNDIKYYNKNNFKLEEIPINLYIYQKNNFLTQKKKR